MKRHPYRLAVCVIVLGGLAIWAYSMNRAQDTASSKITAQAVTPKERDELRKKSLEALATAIRSSTGAHNGVYPFVVPRVETGICAGSSAHCKQAKLVDLSQVLSDGYIAAIPSDPSGGRGQYSSGYTLRRNPDGSIVLLAPRTELGPVISVKL
jgi:hypothetical protein